MKRTAMRVLGGAAALGGAVLTAAVSRAPLIAYPDPTPMVRLAWSVRPERIESCRTLTDAELANVPAHMRQRVQCEGRSANYHLLVTVDGGTLLDTTVTGGGARSDRPVYVLRDVPVPSGGHALAVTFEREPLPADSAADDDDDDDDHDDRDHHGAPDTLLAGRAEREVEERTRRREEAVPPLLQWSDAVTLAPREVLLITYDVDRRAFVSRTRPDQP